MLHGVIVKVKKKMRFFAMGKVRDLRRAIPRLSVNKKAGFLLAVSS
jgi:hypothetical protein